MFILGVNDTLTVAYFRQKVKRVYAGRWCVSCYNQSMNNHLGHEDNLFRVSLKAVLFNQDGHVLVVKEADRDWWDIPGGGIEHGESIKEALARELEEEVSLKGDFEYQAILAEDPRLQQKRDLYQMRLTFLVKADISGVATGVDSSEVKFINPNVFKDSDLITEQKIYEYSELAKLQLERG